MAQQLPLIESRPGTDAAAPVRRRAGRTSGPRGRPQPGSPGATKAFAVSPDRAGVLIEVPAVDWHIDLHTKEVGLAGVAAARQALAAAVRKAPHPEGGRVAA